MRVSEYAYLQILIIYAQNCGFHSFLKRYQSIIVSLYCTAANAILYVNSSRRIIISFDRYPYWFRRNNVYSCAGDTNGCLFRFILSRDELELNISPMLPFTLRNIVRQQNISKWTIWHQVLLKHQVFKATSHALNTS